MSSGDVASVSARKVHVQSALALSIKARSSSTSFGVECLAERSNVCVCVCVLSLVAQRSWMRLDVHLLGATSRGAEKWVWSPEGGAPKIWPQAASQNSESEEGRAPFDAARSRTLGPLACSGRARPRPSRSAPPRPTTQMTLILSSNSELSDADAGGTF